MDGTAVSPIDFPACPLCGNDQWTLIYQGDVRNGPFGSSCPGEVARCSGCGVDRLGESSCLDDQAYASEHYRLHLGQSHDLQHHRAEHDHLARFTLEVSWPDSLRNLVVADVGCGGGVLLDHLNGRPQTLLAIDPDPGFRASLESRGYRWYPDAEQACQEWGGSVDRIFTIQVIEHVSDPLAFLRDIQRLLTPGGSLVLSTPNRNDILMSLLPDDFPSFFYRVQHRWMFDADSLRRCAEQAGLVVEEVRSVHRYGFSNAVHWLRDRRPRGLKALAPLDRTVDGLWRTWLEDKGFADTLYLRARRIEK